MARRLVRIHSLTPVCDAIVEAMARAVDARLASIAAVEPGERRLAIKATYGYPVLLVEHLRIEPGAGVFGLVYQSGRPLRVADAMGFSRNHRRRRPRYRTDSFLAIPISAGDEVLAVVCVADRKDHQSFTALDVSALRALTPPAVLALARAHALAQAQTYAQAAAVDPGSGLFNRRYFHIRIEEELQRSQRHQRSVALLMLDLDDFKAVNDSYGHLIGDAIIKETAGILRQSVRVFDVCTRFGGEEFAIIMAGSGLQSAATVAERIRARVEAYRSPEHILADLSLTVSIGVAVSIPGITAHELISRAGEQLHLAKRAGKNCVR